MTGDVVIAFADTLFRADFVLDKNSDGVIWVKSVEDPSAFGVVKLDNYGFITDFVKNLRLSFQILPLSVFIISTVPKN
jgi:glucose-1-phosphate thymidylyltransferase